MISIRRILVAVDFSPDARAALEHAILLGARLDAPITALHVWSWGNDSRSGNGAVEGFASAPLEELARIDAERELVALLALVQPDGVRIARRLEEGEPGPTILRVAREGYDLVVLGARGRSDERRALVGSTAERVVRHADCAVLTVRAPGPGGR